MYNLATLSSSLTGLVGFRSDGNIILDAPIQLSRSGVFVDGLHPLLTSTNLKGAAIPFGTTTAFITRTIADAITETLTAIRTRKLNRVESRTSLLAPTVLYDGEGRYTDINTPGGRFVGFRLNLAGATNQTFTISRIGIQLTESLSNLPIHIYKDGALIATHLISPATPARMHFSTISQSLTPGNTYLIGYYEANLGTARAIRRSKTIDVTNCASCSPYNAGLRAMWSPHLRLTSIRIDPGPFGAGGIIDSLSLATEVTEQNWGLNLTVAVDCDLTGLFVAQQGLLAPAIGQMAAIKLLSAIAYSPLTTGLEQALREKAMFALKNGEEAKLNAILDATDIELSGLDPRCLPLATNNMIQRKTVFR